MGIQIECTAEKLLLKGRYNKRNNDLEFSREEAKRKTKKR